MDTTVWNQILSLYREGLNCAEIGRRVGMKRTAIRHHLVSRGYPMLHRMGAPKRLSCNEAYFDSIDTPAKAQILGMMYADGCIAKTRSSKTVILCLTEEDKDYLEWAKAELGYAGEVRIRETNSHFANSKPHGRLAIYSEGLFDGLARCGMTERKSLTCQFPIDVVPEHLIPSFVLGYFEGDGSVSFNAVTKVGVASIVGSRDFCRTLANVIRQYVGINCGIEDRATVSLVRVGGRLQLLRFLDWMYRSAPTFRLGRKHAKYLQFKSHCEEVDRLKRPHHIAAKRGASSSASHPHPQCIPNTPLPL